MAQYLKISEFSRLCGIARKNLIFYDEIGLLKPERVEKNGYRYYTIRQLDPASVISALREIGMSLPDIRNYLERRNPEALVELITEQKTVLTEKMDRLRRIEGMLDSRLAMTQRALAATPSEIEVRQCPAEPIFASEIVDSSSEEAAARTAYDFYDLCDLQGRTYGYPLGAIIPQKALEEKGILWPIRYFFNFPQVERQKPNAEKPAGLYLICCEKSYYDVPRDSYDHLFEYMEANGYKVAGDAYEEFLLDEIAVKESDEFLVQISIRVEKTK